MSERSKGMEINSLKDKKVGFNCVLHFVRGLLIAPYIMSSGIQVVVVYTTKGQLENVEISNIPEGTLSDDN
jgi:hypothetical protein